MNSPVYRLVEFKDRNLFSLIQMGEYDEFQSIVNELFYYTLQLERQQNHTIDLLQDKIQYLERVNSSLKRELFDWSHDRKRNKI